MLKLIFCPGHAGVIGNEYADQTPTSGSLTLNLPTVLANVKELLHTKCLEREWHQMRLQQSLSYQWQAAQMHEPNDD